jgi:sugar/nucleoside kinase (ribokinase family)
MTIREITGVLCCGNVVLDIPVWPVEEFTWNTSLWVETVTESIGGNGANTSYTLGMMGVPVRLLSTVGADERGDRLLEILRNAGVDTTFVTRSAAKPTPVSVAVINQKGDRMFLHRPGASRDIEADAVIFDHAAQFSHFHLANPFALPKLRALTADVMARAKAAGLSTSIDAGWDAKGLWIEEIGPALPNTDILFVNESEAQQLGGADEIETAVGNLRSHGATDVVVKLGSEGCKVYSRNGRLDVPAFRAKAVDTTGAGDCFAGAFLAATALGMNYAESARLANAVGAMNVEAIGASAGVRPVEETLRWMLERS